MRAVEVGGIVFELYKWDFRADGDMGQISFLVPKGIYEHQSENGAYVGPCVEFPEYDLARAACPQLRVEGKSEDKFGGIQLGDIVYTAAAFIDKNIRKA